MRIARVQVRLGVQTGLNQCVVMVYDVMPNEKSSLIHRPSLNIAKYTKEELRQ